MVMLVAAAVVVAVDSGDRGYGGRWEHRCNWGWTRLLEWLAALVSGEVCRAVVIVWEYLQHHDTPELSL